jgi:hypothetical protein
LGSFHKDVFGGIMMSEEVKVEGGAENKAVVENKDDVDAQKPEDVKQLENNSVGQEIGWREVIFGGITLLKNIASVVAVLTVIGFAVIHVYMASFSSLFSYNLNIAQYIGAGISLPFVILMLFEKLGSGIFPSVEFIIILIGFVLFYITHKLARYVSRKEWTSSKEMTYYLNITSIMWFIPVIVFLIQTNYSLVPRELGGGQPASVILTFNEEQPLDLWNFAINPEQPRLSEPLQLLIELNDGVLVRQGENYPAVIVKNHIIDAIQDASIPMPQPTASPTPSS